MSPTAVRRLAVVLLVLAGPALAEEPIAFFGGRLRLGGEVSGTIAPPDDGYFNYNDYETDTLRLFRIDVMAEARLLPSTSLLVDARLDNLQVPRLYALYLRVRPWRERDLDLQAGMVPPVFGSFARRRYASDNPLPSLPLVYQYLTIVRDDALPASTEELVAQRGRGWLVRYPIGDTGLAPGRPLVNAERWDTGIELRLGVRPLSLAVALTQGTLSAPKVEDTNGGKQLSARLAWTPAPGFAAGVSAASGAFVTDAARAALPGPDAAHYRQQAVGVDLEWARGYWIVRGEAILSRWRLPAVDATLLQEPLDALGGFVEARYKLMPGAYLAARVERLAMSDVPSALGRQGWDAPVTRLELGAGFTPRRHWQLKASWQHNSRAGGRVESSDLVAAQVLFWF